MCSHTVRSMTPRPSRRSIRTSRETTGGVEAPAAAATGTSQGTAYTSFSSARSSGLGGPATSSRNLISNTADSPAKATMKTAQTQSRRSSQASHRRQYAAVSRWSPMHGLGGCLMPCPPRIFDPCRIDCAEAEPSRPAPPSKWVSNPYAGQLSPFFASMQATNMQSKRQCICSESTIQGSGLMVQRRNRVARNRPGAPSAHHGTRPLPRGCWRNLQISRSSTCPITGSPRGGCGRSWPRPQCTMSSTLGSLARAQRPVSPNGSRTFGPTWTTSNQKLKSRTSPSAD